jgi:hypothetical protein
MGVPAKIVQQQLGQASTETTLQICTHVVPNAQQKAINALERLLFPSCSQVADGDFIRDAVIH